MKHLGIIIIFSSFILGSAPISYGKAPKDTVKKTTKDDPIGAKKADSQQKEKEMTPEKTVSELQIEDLKVGKGTPVKNGDKITVHYRGRLLDGKEFDSSHKRDKPLEVVIGKGLVIKGWDQGLLGMKKGGMRKLTIPPHLAYGSKSVGGVIPANSTLVFDVQLIDITKP